MPSVNTLTLSQGKFIYRKCKREYVRFAPLDSKFIRNACFDSRWKIWLVELCLVQKKVKLIVANFDLAAPGAWQSDRSRGTLRHPWPGQIITSVRHVRRNKSYIEVARLRWIFKFLEIFRVKDLELNVHKYVWTRVVWCLISIFRIEMRKRDQSSNKMKKMQDQIYNLTWKHENSEYNCQSYLLYQNKTQKTCEYTF